MGKWLFLVGSVLSHSWLRSILVVYRNKGISLGVYFTGVNLIVGFFLGLVVYQLLKKFDWKLWFIFTGGLINTIERLYFGYVSDYFNFRVVYNNLPDLLIFIGVIWFFIDGTKDKN